MRECEFRDTDAYERPLVTDFRSGARAAGHSVVDGWKDGVTGFVRRPRAGYRRHGLLGGAGGLLVATANGLVKPTVGSLASVTWLSRGAYADMKEKRRRRDNKSDDKHTVMNDAEARSSSATDSDASRSLRFASVISGYPVEVCQQILDEFERVKKHQKEIAALSPDDSRQHRRKHSFRRWRRDSASGICEKAPSEYFYAMETTM